MRKQLSKTIADVTEMDGALITFLGDIGVFGLREVFEKYPERIYNIGVLEQSTVSMMAGLSMLGFKPVFHSIAPFVVERCLEQLKLDFGYQKLTGNFVSIGASYDYAALGCSHHSPGDVLALLSIPFFPIMIPGSPKEFDTLFKSQYKTGGYYRLSEEPHGMDLDVEYGKALPIRITSENRITIIAVGPMLKMVMEAIDGFKDIDVLYYSTIRPWDHEILNNRVANSNIPDHLIVVTPLYEGTLSPYVCNYGNVIHDYSIPGMFLDRYGKKSDHDNNFLLNADGLRMYIGNL